MDHHYDSVKFDGWHPFDPVKPKMTRKRKPSVAAIRKEIEK